jgi:hypothetical protein
MAGDLKISRVRDYLIGPAEDGGFGGFDGLILPFDGQCNTIFDLDEDGFN